jgi:hypothetical protein
MPLGHSPPSSLLFACKCSFGLAMVDGPHCASFLVFLVFRIAIWNRNTIVSLISVGVWSGGLALQIRSARRIPDWFHHHLMSPPFAFEDLTMVRGLQSESGYTDAHAKSNKISATYNSNLDACTFQHTRTALVNAVGALVVDIVLLVTMLIGLLRHSHRNSSGIWKLLYQQVMLNTFSPSCVGC